MINVIALGARLAIAQRRTFARTGAYSAIPASSVAVKVGALGELAP
jgi:hypothetical protein